MRRPGLVLVAVEALVVLVLLPVTVNVATGGSAPPGLSGLKPYAWYAVALLALIAVGVPAWRYLGDGRGLGGVRYSRYHRETQRERVLQRLRARVDGELARALADVPWIPPRLAGRPDAVRPSPDLLLAAPAEGPPGDVREAFERSDRSLLVLGGPGAGKSTLLLDLARRLLDGDAVPVLLGLGGWRGMPGRAVAAAGAVPHRRAVRPRLPAGPPRAPGPAAAVARHGGRGGPALGRVGLAGGAAARDGFSAWLRTCWRRSARCGRSPGIAPLLGRSAPVLRCQQRFL
jgi:hypothetical protein